MPTALFLSPHLDDVVFSCGGVAALLAGCGWRTVLATVFTRSVVPAGGFALACQLDKGLAAEVDYMALRRAEDAAAAAVLGFGEVRWMDLPEAPHRGYETAAALFGPFSDGDDIMPALTEALTRMAAEFMPDSVLLPEGLGDHVDHRRVGAAAAGVFVPERVAFYRDTPYAIRHAAPARPDDAVVGIASVLDRKIAAAQAYRSQVGFQFGGAEGAARALRAFAMAEGGGVAAERLSGPAAAGLADCARV